MIEMGKSYRTRGGKAVRIYATDAGPSAPIHGAVFDADEWLSFAWQADGTTGAHSLHSFDLIEADPHGILPRHRELLAQAMETLRIRECHPRRIREMPFDEMEGLDKAALIALAKLDNERGGV